MSIAKSNSIPDGARYHTIGVDSYIDKVLQGRLLNQFMEDQVEFHSFMELITILDEWYKMIDYPAEGMQKRRFIPPDHEFPYLYSLQAKGDNYYLQYGKLATFVIKVQYQQHASWQGTIKWLESGKEECFRSTLELMVLIDNVLMGM